MLVTVAPGLSNAEIASLLTVSYATAKTHVRHLLTKLERGTERSWSCSPTSAESLSLGTSEAARRPPAAPAQGLSASGAVRDRG